MEVSGFTARCLHGVFFSLFDVGTLRFVYLESEVLGVNIAVLLTYLIIPYLTNKDGLAVMSSLGAMIFFGLCSAGELSE